MAVGGAGGGTGAAIKAGLAVVTAKLDDAPLKGGLNAAKKYVMDWGASIAKTGAGLAGIGAAIEGPILGASYAAIERFNEMRKAADQLGTTPEIFSGLAFAVKKFGIDSQGLVGASRFMERFVAKAQEGGSAAEAFEKIGLDAKELIKLP